MKVIGNFVLIRANKVNSALIELPDSVVPEQHGTIIALGDGKDIARSQTLCVGAKVYLLPHALANCFQAPDGQLYFKADLNMIAFVFEEGEREKMVMDKELAKTRSNILAA